MGVVVFGEGFLEGDGLGGDREADLAQCGDGSLRKPTGYEIL